VRIYEPRLVRRSRRVLLELAVILRPFRGRVVVIGGWAANLLVRSCAEQAYRRAHLGTIDVDLMLGAADLAPADYPLIRQLLLDNGYESLEFERDQAPFAFRRRLREANDELPIKVDVMVPDTLSRPRDHPIERAGLWCMRLRGGLLAARYHRPVRLRGSLPDGRRASATIRVADFPAFLTLKGLALGDHHARRDHSYQKHAYDISCVLYACGPTRVAEEVQQALAAERPQTRRDLEAGLTSIFASFSHLDAGGPEAAAVVRSQGDTTDLARYTNDAFFAVAEFLETLGYHVTR